VKMCLHELPPFRSLISSPAALCLLTGNRCIGGRPGEVSPDMVGCSWDLQ
jgi:hypothetical protein